MAPIIHSGGLRASPLSFYTVCIVLAFWLAVLGIDFILLQTGFSGASIFGNALVSGALLGTPYTEFYLKDFVGYGILTTWLYEHFPQVAWLPVLFLVLMLVSLLLPSCIIYERFNLLFGGKRVLGALLLFAVVAIVNLNLVTLEHNRVAFLLMISGLSIPLLYGPSTIPVKQVVYAAAMAVLAAFLRVEAAIGVFIVMGPVLLYGYRHHLQPLFKWLAMPAAVVGGYALCMFIALEKSPLYYYQIEPDFEYELMDKNNIVPVSAMATAYDSIRYEAIGKYWFLGDSTHVPPQFIRSLIQKQNSMFDRYLPSLQGKAFKSLTEKLWLLAAQPVVWVFVLLVFIAATNCATAADRRWLLVWAVYTLGVLVVLVGSINQDIEPRIVEPVLTAATVCLLPLLLQLGGSGRSIRLVAGTLAVMVALLTQYHARERNLNMQLSGRQNQTFLAKVNELSVQYVGLFTYGELFNFAPSAFAGHKMFPGKTVLPLHLAQYSHTATLKSYLQKTTGCGEHKFDCLINFLITHKTRSAIIASPQAMAFLQQYMNIVYGIQLTYAEVNQNLQVGGLTVYRIN